MEKSRFVKLSLLIKLIKEFAKRLGVGGVGERRETRLRNQIKALSSVVSSVGADVDLYGDPNRVIARYASKF